MSILASFASVVELKRDKNGLVERSQQYGVPIVLIYTGSVDLKDRVLPEEVLELIAEWRAEEIDVTVELPTIEMKWDDDDDDDGADLPVELEKEEEEEKESLKQQDSTEGDKAD
jgi:hypothetical protein